MNLVKHFSILAVMVLGTQAAFAMTQPSIVIKEIAELFGKGTQQAKTFRYTAIRAESDGVIEHTFVTRLNGDGFESIQEFRLMVLPGKDMRQSAAEFAERGAQFRIMGFSSGSGRTAYKNQQAAAILQVAANRINAKWPIPLEHTQSGRMIGTIRLDSTEEMQRLLRSIEDVVSEINVQGSEAVIGRVPGAW